MATLILPKKLYFRSLQQAVQQQCPGQVVDQVDFGRVDWVQPSGMASLAALVRWQQERGAVKAVRASEAPAFRYFQDMDFFRSFGVFAEEDFTRHPENRAFARLVEIQQTGDSTAIARNLAKIVAGHAKPIHNDLFTCLEESVRNVIDWAGKPGHAVAQTQNVPGGQRTYNIAIADYGCGIQAALSRNPRYRDVDARAALELAVQKGVSTATVGMSDNFGIGLFEIDRIAETTRGRFILGSAGWVRIREGTTIRFEPIHPWQGTVVELTLYLSGFRVVHGGPTKPGRLRFD